MARSMTYSKFLKFHRQNPHIYDYLVEAARDEVFSGKTKLGINSLMELCRWNMKHDSKRDEMFFKLNNSMAPWYARAIIANEPDLARYFDLRRSDADSYDFTMKALNPVKVQFIAPRIRILQAVK